MTKENKKPLTSFTLQDEKIESYRKGNRDLLNEERNLMIISLERLAKL
jgi:hypothetical protein